MACRFFFFEALVFFDQNILGTCGTPSVTFLMQLELRFLYIVLSFK